MVEIYKNIIEKTTKENVDSSNTTDENIVQQTLIHPQYFGNN